MIEAKLSGDRIFLDFTEATKREEAEGRSFLSTLPSVARKQGGFSCQRTPATAAQIHLSGLFKVSRGVFDLAEEFTEGLRERSLPHHDLKFKTDPWSHQMDAFSFSFWKASSMLALEMGTGKTKVAIDLVTNWMSETVLILCPKSVLGVWFREFDRHSVDPVEILILDRGTGKRKSEKIENLMTDPTKIRKVVVINYESLLSKDVKRVVSAIHWGAVIADESHRIKSPTGKTSKLVSKLKTDRRLCLTGTPMPHSPLDLFAQFRFLDAGILGGSFTSFRNRYAVTNPRFPSQVRRWKNQDELNELFKTVAFRVRAEDVLDLPPVTHEVIPITLDAPKVYRDIESEFVADVNEGRIVVNNALTKLLRLQQLTGGHCVTEDGEVIRTDTAKERGLSDLIEGVDTSEKVVVFCRFREDLKIVRKTAKNLGRQYGEISGSQKDILQTGEMPDDVQVLGVQIQSGGVGIDLTKARIAIYYSIGFSLGDYEQSLARCHRAGQEKSVIFYHLVVTGTIDEKVYQALSDRRDIVESVMESISEADQ